MKLNEKIVEAARQGDGGAIRLATELLGKIKVVDLTDEQADELARIARGY